TTRLYGRILVRHNTDSPPGPIPLAPSSAHGQRFIRRAILVPLAERASHLRAYDLLNFDLLWSLAAIFCDDHPMAGDWIAAKFRHRGGQTLVSGKELKTGDVEYG